MHTPADSVTIFAPATVANLAVGYDCLGLAIDGPGDEIILRRSDTPGLKISAITGDQGRLPTEVSKNTAGIAAQHVLEKLGQPDLGLEMEIHKKMPFGSGLGSSAASAVGGAFAVNCLLGHPLTREQLLEASIVGESFASGSRHADNVAPCLFGGLVLVRSADDGDFCHLPVPQDLHIAVVHPDLEILTKDARSRVPKSLPTHEATSQMADIASFVHACHLGDLELMRRTLVDRIAEPGRKDLIAGFDGARDAAIAAGAIGFSISGAGPSVFSFADSQKNASAVAAAISACFTARSISNTAHVSAINSVGVTQL